MKDDILNGDPAAVFGCAHSLWDACHKAASKDETINLSELYNGMDELMRVVLRIANRFEDWATKHVDFDQLTDIWPYLLQDKFGEACLAVKPIGNLTDFTEADCFIVACASASPRI